MRVKGTKSFEATLRTNMLSQTPVQYFPSRAELTNAALEGQVGVRGRRYKRVKSFFEHGLGTEIKHPLIQVRIHRGHVATLQGQRRD